MTTYSTNKTLSTRGTFLTECRMLAYKLHGKQKYANRDYSVHLRHVVNVLQRFDINDTNILAAGYLHDSIEDTAATKDLLEVLTNKTVARLVDAVTDGKGKSRAERKQRPYKLIPKVEGAIFLKLADRIANLETGHANKSSLLSMYKKEQQAFEDHLLNEAALDKRKDLRLNRMWDYCRLLASS